MDSCVLLVDDDQLLTEGLRRRLHAEPYHVLTAPSALVALELLSKHPIAVVVVDENMPAGKGSEFVAFLAKHRPEIPCIMLTGVATTALAIKAVNLGNVLHFFTKPCNVVELAIAIRDGLALYAERQAQRRAELRSLTQVKAGKVYELTEQKESLEQLVERAMHDGLLKESEMPTDKSSKRGT